MLWILVGGVFAGAVHDFVVLFISSRRNGKSLGEIIKEELGTISYWSADGRNFEYFLDIAYSLHCFNCIFDISHFM